MDFPFNFVLFIGLLNAVMDTVVHIVFCLNCRLTSIKLIIVHTFLIVISNVHFKVVIRKRKIFPKAPAVWRNTSAQK